MNEEEEREEEKDKGDKEEEEEEEEANEEKLGKFKFLFGIIGKSSTGFRSHLESKIMC